MVYANGSNEANVANKANDSISAPVAISKERLLREIEIHSRKYAVAITADHAIVAGTSADVLAQKQNLLYQC